MGNAYGPTGVFNAPVTMLGRRPISWPYRVGVIPPLAECRQDRDADDALTEAVAGWRTTVVCQILTGLGGVGKTQVAASLAHRLWRQEQIDLLIWATATSRASIVSVYAQAAADITGVDDDDPEQACRRLLVWLDDTDRSWLVVLDDLAEPDDLTGLWPPETIPNGRTVVTTRRRDAALTGGRHIIDVGLFTPAQSTAYLQAKFVGMPQLNDDPDGLATALGHLPLALAQAVAYMADRNLTCTAYRRRFSAKQLTDLRPLSLPDQHRAIVAATWRLSVDLAERLAPAGDGRPLLEIIALLDPNGVPIGLFGNPAIISYCTIRTRQRVDVDDTLDTLYVLHRLSLASVDHATSTVRMHALVQRVVREAIEPTDMTALIRATADALLDIWPDVEQDAIAVNTLRANTTILRGGTGDALLSPEIHPVLLRSARSMGEAGLIQPAIKALKKLLEDTLRIFGRNHPDTLAIGIDLLRWRAVAGDPGGAAMAFAHLLDNCLRILGPDHPDTLMTRHRLALCWGEAGDPRGAAIAFEHLLADCLRVFGPDHPDTLATRANVANWWGVAGDADGAATELEQLLDDYLRMLGPDHPDILAVRSQLARWRGAAGNPDGAATALKEILDDRLQALGPTHPQILATRNNLAYWQGKAGDPGGAAIALKLLLDDCLRVLGPDHPHTLMTRGNLAAWQGEAGDPSGAAAAYEQLLEDRLRVLGPDHPDILVTRGNLAHMRRQASELTR
ncbi:tetratricopeptide repeat protein [Virgisporangium aurantiacum]|uniref:ATP-binding protein n=1 Tax=Virgisporangium aurantiacum TaxID=175570 RepID=A0A8J4E710_9ACTN|nr:tetratricopeptide repeat protein [Virgisporangium aurantiacum]GIJ64645.1 ATP-binding protein [Virgisporangium aurantiacum]